MLENRAYIDALRRSFQLTKGYGFRIVAVFTLTWLIAFVLGSSIPSLVYYFTTDKLAIAVPSSAHWTLQLLHTLCQALTTPIPAIASVLLYYDIRVRKEGFDLRVLADDMKASDADRV